MLTSRFEIDVTPGGIPPVVNASQYDAGSRTLEFTLISGTGDFVPPSGVKAEVRGTKPDGNGFSYESRILGRVVTVVITEQMTAVAGKVRCEIALYTGTPATNETPASDDYTQLCTANFILMVERAALDKDTLSSESEVRQLVNVIDRSNEIIAAANRSDAAKEAIQRMIAQNEEGMQIMTAQAEHRLEEITQQTQEYLEQKKQEAETELGAIKTETIAARDRAIQSEDSAAETLRTVNERAAQIVQVTTNADTLAAQAMERASNAENEAAETANALDQLNENVALIRLMSEGKVDDAYVENGYLYLTSNDEVVAGPLGPFSGTGGGGGGGSSGNNAQISVTNRTGWLSRTIAQDDRCPVTIYWTSEEDDVPTGNGTMRITVSGSTKAMLDVAQGDVTVDLSSYLSAGSNVVKINIADIYGNSRTINFSITVVVLTVSSTFDDSVAYQGPIIFPYTPVGNIQKTMHFLIDDREIGSATTSVSGRQQSFTIPQQTHGEHSFRCWFEADINGSTVRSNELYFEIICLETLNMTPIITSSFRETEVPQYSTVHIGYSVYDPASMTAAVTIRLNGRQVSEQTVGRTKQDYSMRMDTVGDYTIEIESGGVTRSFSFTVTESAIKIEAETEALALYLSSQGRSNNENERGTWNYGDIAAELSGFNYASDGWQKDGDGSTVLRVAGDARVNIPYQIFGSDCRQTGKTIELEFATRTVMNYDAVILSCLSGGRGIFLTAQQVKLMSEQSEISMQFKENEHVRVAFVVEKRSENRLIYCYINGIMSGTVQYPASDDFAQTSPVGISIGSNDCTIDIYCIRVYDNDLTRSQVLDNWIADTQSVEDMLSRYQRNRVYDEYGQVVKERLPSDLPYLIIECPELPQYKGDKKTVSGSYTDPQDPSRNFTFTGAQFDVQGTSSQYYERKNYKGKFKNGFDMVSGGTVSGYKLREDSIPVSTFCFKADVASSEGANNVELVRLYDMACPYKTPGQRGDSRVRQGIDGFPIVIFWYNGETTQFMGKYNWNNDKSTEDVFGFQPDDESWEVKNNTSDRVLWKSADYGDDAWLGDFEGRYPDGYEDPTQLREFAEWIVETDTETATGALLDAPVDYGDATYTHDTSEYRLAKFKAELPNYVEMQSALFYYLFTELFLMVDSRAKNMFPSFMGSPVT